MASSVMSFMLFNQRTLAVALFSLVPWSASVQVPGVLHIKIVVVDVDGKATPVPRHALLISDNPTSAAPRRIVTTLDGTADVRLRPGNYTVESDEPLAFQGKAYQWRHTLDIAAGREATLDLTADNAEIEPIGLGAADAASRTAGAATSTTSTGPPADDPSSLLAQWNGSVIALWTPTTRTSGFVVDANGLMVTSQRGILAATSVEAQITPTVKVAAQVLVADPVREVAVLRIDPTVVASVRPVPLGCEPAGKAPIVSGQEIFTIGAPIRQRKGISAGIVREVENNVFLADFSLATGGAGGPVFSAGRVVGVTAIVDDRAARRGADSRVIGLDEVCQVVASAEKKLKDAAAPNGTLLPVEPARPFPLDAIKDEVRHFTGRLNPYQFSSSGFDVTFITPVLVHGGQNYAEQARRRGSGALPPTPDREQSVMRVLLDFSNWSDYVADVPPVLLVRVTPRLVEGFWMKVARGAAQTQGVSMPPIKRLKSGFSRLRAFCGADEVAPIHPFKLEHSVDDTDVIYEGLYVFDPGALGPPCGSVKLMLYSEKEPNEEDTRIVEPKLLEQIWQDFAPYRALK
jgi:hypothetical protein